ncbi:MAG: biotin--[acetyl-CoA-carboxylase] ligase [Lachnospiraceae bacterium]|nr:biotin--[acetyl-CoA-carboxylase] ligase [Lachnospiraceae bacterium]
MEADLKIYDELDSTNITLEELAACGAPEGTCVIAFCQRKGQGRSGRDFYSPAGGNLYMSLLLRPQDEESCSLITVTAAVAVCAAIEEQFGISAGIKWVNDIYLGGRKVCGIVAQAHDYGGLNMHVVLGIGINIYDPDTIPEDIPCYGSLMGKSSKPEPDRRSDCIELAEKIISEFASYYEHPDWDAVSDYRRRCIVIGKRVEYLSGNGTVVGQVRGIDDDGGIIIETDGRLEKYRDGEIRIKLTDC